MCARKRVTKSPTPVDEAPAGLEELKDGLDVLDRFENDVLEVLSLFYKSTRAAKVLAVLKACGIRDAGNGAVTARSLGSVFERLKRLGLAEGSGDVMRCARPIVELVSRRMVLEGRFKACEPLVREELNYTNRWGDYVNFSSPDHAIANLRLPLFARNFKRLDRVLDDIALWDDVASLDCYPISGIINNPFDRAWLASFPEALQGPWVAFLLEDIARACDPPDEVTAHALDLAVRVGPDDRLSLRFYTAELAFLQGRFDDAFAAVEGESGLFQDLIRARLLLVSGAPDEAAAVYEMCLEGMKKATRKRKPKFPTIDWGFFIIALIDAGDAHWPRALELARQGANDRTYEYRALCESLVLLIQAQSVVGLSALAPHSLWGEGMWMHERGVLEKLFRLWIDAWLRRDTAKRDADEIAELCVRLRENGYCWLESEFAELLHLAVPRLGDFGDRAQHLRDTMEVRSLAHVIRPVADWERALKALARVRKPDAAADVVEKQSRLVWIVTDTPVGCLVQAKEQKSSANGRWTKGRVVSLKRLREESRLMGFLTPQDLAACDYISADSDRHYWGRHDIYYEMGSDVVIALVGHPHVYREDSGAQVEVVAARPELRVTSEKGNVKLKMIPPKPDVGSVHTVFEGDTRLVVYEFTEDIKTVAGILGKGVTVPDRARDEVLKAVGNVSSLVTVHSDIGAGDASIPTVAADTTPIIQLLPAGEGLLVHLRVQPLPGGPLFAPADGGEVVIAEVDGVHMQARRDFAGESSRANGVIGACPSLVDEGGAGSEWRLESPEDCLEFLMELEAVGPEVQIQWPKGRKFAIQGSAGLAQLRLKVTGGNNWFELAGDVKVDDNLVLDMQRLLELTADSKSRFIDLGEGQFVALTRAFRRKLDELRGVGEERDGGLRMHALAAPMVDDLADQVKSLKANKQWKEQVQRLQKARDLDPEIPSTLRATLRDYQVDGYKWLARLAEWGVGACLADDMGLGKTVQILTLMLARAGGGPQLVVAPTSVCANWEEEGLRFTPTLRVHRFGAGNREEVLTNLGAFDVLVCSYGLLQSEGALFKDVTWQTIVLDEAQAIKNMATKRSKAVMDLNGDFKVIATGTPIENHLGELWNLYRFINPGFLGSLERFNTQFALPIEKHGDRDTRHHLKNLIQPFILRRLKEDVLDELPARTDIVLHVELGEKERAFYEALRLRALKQLSDVKAAPGKHHVRILAEIMRLRRACCNTRLVDPGSSLPSAKLEVFEAVLDDLMENRHKALVFSQFVDHLSILRALLDKKGVAYQYLDGSTPAPARKKAVDAFQRGEGDVFLISLKAGGLGLNLTAADYVIHMDPWWNPAVEDQASDRAHRIGQLRPVTVYRLVVRGTIEDQITALHHRKRDLANSLLEGSDMAGKVTSEELLELLRSG